jgi:polyhydroxybutyrate depolymerase
MLTYRFAAERGNLLAAVAPLAASIGGKPSQEAPEWHIPKPKAPISIIAFHGLNDDDVPVEGGISRYRKNTRSYWSVEKSIDFWVSDNACKTKKADTFLKNGYVQIKSWVDCRNGNEIVLYLLKDWGHVWPGRYFTTALEDTHPLKNFDAAEIIWDFFKRHRRIPYMSNTPVNHFNSPSLN